MQTAQDVFKSIPLRIDDCFMRTLFRLYVKSSEGQWIIEMEAP